ncbi:hypothetical protein Tco_0055854, partial [Tanacetum coccineum]
FVVPASEFYKFVENYEDLVKDLQDKDKKNTSRTNEVSTASRNFGVNTVGGTNSSSQVSSTPGADEAMK